MNDYLIEKLKEGRKNKGLRQSDVTKLTGIKATTLSNYENGITEPDIDTFLMLCDLYSLDFADILAEGYGYKVPGADFDIRLSEIDMIKEYRALDEHGQEVVRILLQKEYERCSASQSQADVNTVIDIPNRDLPELNAAHERTDIEVTDDMRRHDDDIMDDDDF
jgi:transcriptional regulator with XRE-family HTH domain